MKGDYFLSDLKNKKCKQIFLNKNSSQVDFFDSKFPCETRISLFNRLSSTTNTKLMHFVAWKVILNKIFIAKILIWTKITLKVNQISRVRMKLR